MKLNPPIFSLLSHASFKIQHPDLQSESTFLTSECSPGHQYKGSTIKAKEPKGVSSKNLICTLEQNYIYLTISDVCFYIFFSLTLSWFKQDRYFLYVPLETMKEAKKVVVTAVSYNPIFISNLLLKGDIVHHQVIKIVPNFLIV